jgi:hypothetical protein
MMESPNSTILSECPFFVVLVAVLHSFRHSTRALSGNDEIQQFFPRLLHHAILSVIDLKTELASLGSA